MLKTTLRIEWSYIGVRGGLKQLKTINYVPHRTITPTVAPNGEIGVNWSFTPISLK